MSNFNYRKYYKNYYNIDFDKKYVVHHIDCNRENNNIHNLVLLPVELHIKYHNQKIIIENIEMPTKICGNGNSGYSCYLYELKKFINILEECNKWYDYKMYLEGIIPNFHNIDIRS